VSGYVYAVTNPSINDIDERDVEGEKADGDTTLLVKIGQTNNVSKRLADLYDTNVPTPFELVCNIEVDDPVKVEAKLHRFLEGCRVSKKREFFRASANLVKRLFALADQTKREDRLCVSIPGVGKVSSESLSALHSLMEKLNIDGIRLPALTSAVDRRNQKGWTLEQTFNIHVPPNYTVNDELVQSHGFEYFPERPWKDGNAKPYVSRFERRVYLSQLEFAKEKDIPPDFVSDKARGYDAHEVIDMYEKVRKNE